LQQESDGNTILDEDEASISEGGSESGCTVLLEYCDSDDDNNTMLLEGTSESGCTILESGIEADDEEKNLAGGRDNGSKVIGVDYFNFEAPEKGSASTFNAKLTKGGAVGVPLLVRAFNALDKKRQLKFLKSAMAGADDAGNNISASDLPPVGNVSNDVPVIGDTAPRDNNFGLSKTKNQDLARFPIGRRVLFKRRLCAEIEQHICEEFAGHSLDYIIKLTKSGKSLSVKEDDLTLAPEGTLSRNKNKTATPKKAIERHRGSMVSNSSNLGPASRTLFGHFPNRIQFNHCHRNCHRNCANIRVPGAATKLSHNYPYEE
jgi:hypothetical protein